MNIDLYGMNFTTEVPPDQLKQQAFSCDIQDTRQLPPLFADVVNSLSKEGRRNTPRVSLISYLVGPLILDISLWSKVIQIQFPTLGGDKAAPSGLDVQVITLQYHLPPLHGEDRLS